MKKQFLVPTGLLLITGLAFGQVPSTDGTFSAAGTTNLSLRTNTTSRLTILGSGTNIGFTGIGTATPVDLLHVFGNARANQFNATNGIFNTPTAGGNLSFMTNGTTRLTMLGASGNLGIGTATPARLLTVMAASPVINIQTSSAANDPNVRMLRFARFDDTALGSLELYGSSGEFRMNTSTSYFPTFYSNGVEAMRINTAGNVGIGTNAPTEKLEVIGNIKASNDIMFNGIFGLKANVGVGMKIGTFSGGAGWDIQMIDNNGAVAYNKFSAASNVIGGITPTNASALFEIQSTTKGFLPPRMTSAQRTAIASPATGLIVYQTDGQLGTYQFDGTNWGQLAIGGGSSQWATNGATINYPTGNVGIGTTTPTEKLDVNGNIKLNSGSIYWTWVNQAIERYTPDANSSVIRFRNSMDAGSGNPNGGFDFADHGGSSVMKITNYNVGIGTTSPNAKLHILFPGSSDPSNQAIQIESTNPSYYSSAMLKNSSGDIGLFGFTGASYNWGMHLPRQAFINSGTPNGIALISYDPNGIITFGTGGYATTNERVRIDKLGNVGIGTTTPSYKLDVAGAINATSILVNGVPISGGGASQWITNSSDISYSTGKVGIGTAPSFKLHIRGSNPNSDLMTLGATNTGNFALTSADGGAYGLFAGVSNTGRAWLQAGRYDTNTAYDLTLQTAGGNVGIGTFAPSAKLDVSGNTKISSTLDVGGNTKISTTLDVGGTRNVNSSQGGLNIYDYTVGDYTNIQFAQSGFGGAGAILFNAYKSSAQVAGDLTAFGNTKHSNDVGAYTAGSGMIHYLGNGGRMDFFLSQNSSGKDTNVNWQTPILSLVRNGYVGIGTAAPDAKLTVKGNIHTNEVKVDLLGAVAPDYVFEKEYNLMSLEDTKAYIDANKHLPEVPSAKEMEKNGVQLGEMNMLLLKKVEELTLHLIELKKENEALKNRVEKIENKK
jgi:hypothetical protein